MHEDFFRAHDGRRSSDRSFGYVFAAVFAIIAMWPTIRSDPPHWWAFFLMLVFLVLATVRPSLLAPLNKVRIVVGDSLRPVVIPAVTALVFYFAVVPTGYILRMMRKGPLQSAWDETAETYWIPKDPQGPPPETMRNQF